MRQPQPPMVSQPERPQPETSMITGSPRRQMRTCEPGRRPIARRYAASAASTRASRTSATWPTRSEASGVSVVGVEADTLGEFRRLRLSLNRWTWEEKARAGRGRWVVFTDGCAIHFLVKWISIILYSLFCLGSMPHISILASFSLMKVSVWRITAGFLVMGQV